MLLRLLALTVVLGSACASTVGAPVVHVPLLRRAGQTEAGLIFGTGSAQREIGGTLRVAATDHLRVGGSVSGATSRDAERGLSAETEQRSTPRLFADGFVGAEWGGLLFRLGALAGAGYGRRSLIAGRCESAMRCTWLGTQEQRFVRSYGQLHLGLAPPGPLAVSVALRVPVIVDLARANLRRETEVGTEIALTHSFIFRFFRLDLQPLWSRIEGFSFHLSLLFRFQPPARESLARRY